MRHFAWRAMGFELLTCVHVPARDGEIAMEAPTRAGVTSVGERTLLGF